ncbi:MAG: TIGR02281 family clan AA aspartic protease [Pseudomonadota bacterium]
MDTNDIPRLIYLGLLLAVVGGWFFLTARRNGSKTFQQAAIWVFIFLGAIAAVGLWNDIRNTVAPRAAVSQNGTVTVPRSADGHYYLTLAVNGAPVRFVVDTGATDIVLTQGDAARAGLDPANLRYIGQASTANGVVQTAPVRLDTIALGPVIDRNVPAVVNGAEMFGSLLGMGYLQRWRDIRISGGELVLSR